MAFSDQAGIFSTFPSTDPDAANDPFIDDQIYARAFACPGAGDQVINKIGGFVEYGTSKCRLMIYTDSAGSPGTLVSDSLTTEVTGVAGSWVYHTYGTKPILTGGATYWLAYWGNSTGETYGLSFGGSGYVENVGKSTAQAYSNSGTPTGESWGILNNQFQIAAEYQAAGGGGVVVASYQMYYNRMRRVQ